MTRPDRQKQFASRTDYPASAGSRRSNRTTVQICALAAAALTFLCAPAVGQNTELLALGRSVAETNCVRCHAIGSEGVSTHPEAPPFRALSDRYPIESLQEAFVEGIYVGHSDMPAFELDPADAEALLAYIGSVQ